MVKGINGLNLDAEALKMDLESVSLIELKIKLNKVDESDFTALAKFISAIGGKSDFLRDALKTYGFNGAAEYVLASRQPNVSKNVKSLNAFLQGVLFVVKNHAMVSG